ncbi:MAG: LacI family DNA-binding transcriptional regulator [Ruminococcaceae bacterium]|nr:LacI family DNA-binding transcriptional regulator [Oscillospiraceae bacterium]
MSKRLLCLLLGLLMVLSVAFTGCSAQTDEEEMDDIAEEASESAMTLTMYLMSEEEVSKDQADKIEEAVNKITKSKFKTRIVLRYFTEEQYYDALDKAFKETKDAKKAAEDAAKALKEAIKRGEVTSQTTTDPSQTTEEETEVNEYGVSTLKYPGVTDYQVDIFYVGGYENFKRYNTGRYIKSVDDQLSGVAKSLYHYIAPEFLSIAKKATEEAETYIIPNNRTVGEYTYLLLNKDLLTKYGRSKDEFENLTSQSLQDFMKEVKTYEAANYVPLESKTGDIDTVGIYYLGLDENNDLSHDFSILGSTQLEGNKYYEHTLAVTMDGGLANGFRSQVRTLISYKELGYCDNPNNLPFAVGYVKGDAAEMIEQYSDEYEMVVVERPVAETGDVFEHGFAVGYMTSSANRSMQIINYLNTNADFRNLLLYGIEGENYEVVEKTVDGVVYKMANRLNYNYVMDENKTGNVILAYPLDIEGETAENIQKYNLKGDLPNIREYQKAQNRDIKTLIDAGYVPTDVDKELMADLREESAELKKLILECSTVAEFDAMMEELYNFYNNPGSETAYNTARLLTDDSGSLAYSYQEWLKLQGITINRTES